MYAKPNVIVYVRRSGIVVAGKKLTPARMSFDDSTVNNLEVLDHAKLIEQCQKFFTKQGIKHKRVLMVLDASLVFSKTVTLNDNAGQPVDVIDQFVAAMPFNRGQRACISNNDATVLTLYATNIALFDAVREALSLCGNGKVVAITPSAAYDLTDGQQTSGTAVDKFLHNVQAYRTYNFVHAQTY